MVKITAPVMSPIVRPPPCLSDSASATFMQASGHSRKEFWSRIARLEKEIPLRMKQKYVLLRDISCYEDLQSHAS
jgi:hypothetical protein